MDRNSQTIKSQVAFKEGIHLLDFWGDGVGGALMYVGPIFTALVARVWSPATPAGKHLGPRLLNVPPCLHVSSLQLIGALECR